MARSRNRDAAIKKRSQPITKSDSDTPIPGPEQITDEELYKDRHYGIRFATLLNPAPDHLNQLRKTPIAAWGHDMARTLDGGRVRVTDDEIRAVTVSTQAAQLIVMEAKARGWETLRISGDNEFCAAVKQACKEQGMGAIITRRGPLGIGPFSRPEVIMPRLPDPLGPQVPSPEQRRKEQSAPPEDAEAARRLLGDGAPKGPADAPEGRPGQAPEPAQGGKRDEGRSSGMSGDEADRGPRPGPAKLRLDEVDVSNPLPSADHPDPAQDEDWTPIQRL